MAGAISMPKNPTQAALLLSLVLLALGVYNRVSHHTVHPVELSGQRPARSVAAVSALNSDAAIADLGARLDSLQHDLPNLVASQIKSGISSEIQRAVSNAIGNQGRISEHHVEEVVVQHHDDHAAHGNSGHCETAELMSGLPARTEEEVMSKSKQDKQYLGGIKNKAATGSLVDSKDYWEKRYAAGGNSGAGSYNMIGVFKALVVNNFVKDNNVNHVIEFGFGDGQQLTRAEYPKYTGLDVSETILTKTSKRFEKDPTKHFQLYDGHTVPGLTADLTLSFDVIYHLVEDQVYYNYMDALFSMSTKYVIVYSSNIDGWHGAAHVLHRNNTKYIAKTFPNWKFLGSLRNKYPEKTAQDFFFYAKCD